MQERQHLQSCRRSTIRTTEGLMLIESMLITSSSRDAADCVGARNGEVSNGRKRISPGFGGRVGGGGGGGSEGVLRSVSQRVLADEHMSAPLHSHEIHVEPR